MNLGKNSFFFFLQTSCYIKTGISRHMLFCKVKSNNFTLQGLVFLSCLFVSKQSRPWLLCCRKSSNILQDFYFVLLFMLAYENSSWKKPTRQMVCTFCYKQMIGALTSIMQITLSAKSFEENVIMACIKQKIVSMSFFMLKGEESTYFDICTFVCFGVYKYR